MLYHKTKQRIKYVLIGAIIVIILSWVVVYRELQNLRDNITCVSIGNFKTAQLDLDLYKKDPVKYSQFKGIDRDKDGVACESLKK